MNELFCIFCESPLDNSDEHIIPQSVNGTLHSTKLICQECNSNFFGRHIDPIIKKLLNPLLLILGWENSSSMKGEDIDGGEYVMSKGMKSIPIRPVREEKKYGNGKLVTIKGDPKNTIKMFQKEYQKFKEQGEYLAEYSLSVVKNSTPFIRAKWEIEISPELILLMNKIAVEFYAFRNLDYSVIEVLCKKIRRFDNTLSNVLFCNQKNQIRDFSSYEVSHLILIQNDAISGCLYAYIEIFNIICCTLILVENYKGKDVLIQYHQDALTGERFTNEVKLKMTLSEILSYKFKADNFEFLFNSLSTRLQSRDFQKDFNEQLGLLRDGLKQKEENGEIRKKDFEKMYLEQSAELFAYLTIYDYPYIIEDRNDEENDDYNYIHSNFRKELVDEFYRDYNYLLGKKLKTKEGIFTISKFYEKSTIVKNDKSLKTLFFVLVNDRNGDQQYIKVKIIIDILIDAMKRLEAASKIEEE